MSQAMIKFAPLAWRFAWVLAGQMPRIYSLLQYLQGKTYMRTHVTNNLIPSIDKNTHAHVCAPLQVPQPLQTQTPARAKRLQGYARATASTATLYLLKNNKDTKR